MGSCVSSFKSAKDRSAASYPAPEAQPSMKREEKPAPVAPATVVNEKDVGCGEGGNEVEEGKGEELGQAVWFQDDTRRRSLGLLFRENVEPKNSLVVESKVSDKEPDVEKPSKEAEVTTLGAKEIDVKAVEVEISEKIIQTKQVDQPETETPSEEAEIKTKEIEKLEKSVQEEKSTIVASSMETSVKHAEVVAVEKSTQIEEVSMSNDASKDSKTIVGSETPDKLSGEAEIKTKEIEILEKSFQEEKSTIVASSIETNVKQVEALTVERSTQIEEIPMSKDASNDSKAIVGGSETPDKSTREDQQPDMEKPSGEAEIKTKEIEILEKSIQEKTSSTETNVKQVQVLTVEKSTQIEEMSMSAKDSKTIVGSETHESSVEQVGPQEEVETSAKDVESETTVIEEKDFEQDVNIDKESTKIESDVKEEDAIKEPVKDPK